LEAHGGVIVNGRARPGGRGYRHFLHHSEGLYLPIRLGVIEKYRFGKVAREEQIFSVDQRMGIVFHKAALQG
jgi:hypothetical protein